jgi:hypothetical protein
MARISPNWTVSGSLDVVYLQFVPVEFPRLSTTHTSSQVLFSLHILCFLRNLYTRSRRIANNFLLYTMQLTTLVLAAGLTLAVAQTTTSTSTSISDITSTSSVPAATSSACAAQPYASQASLILPPRPKSSTLTFLSLGCSMPVSPLNKPK